MAEFLPKSQVQVSGIGAPRVSALANDLSTLFVVAGKASEKFAQVGEQAAKEDFIARSNEAREKITAIKTGLENDPYNIELYDQSRQAIDIITAELVAQRDAYKDSQIAYDAYSEMSTRFAVDVKDQFYPSLASGQFNAIKRARISDINTTSLSAQQNNLPLNPDFARYAVDTFKTLGENPLQASNGVFSTNFSIMNGLAAKDIMQFAIDNKLVLADKTTGELTYNPNAEADIVDKFVGSHMKIENGVVLPNADYTTQEQVETVNKFFGSLRGNLLKENGTPNNPEFDALLAESKTVLTNSPEVMADNQEVLRTLSFDLSKLSKSQKEALDQFRFQYAIVRDNNVKARQLIGGLLQKGDIAGTITALRGGTGGIKDTYITHQAGLIMRETEANFAEAVYAGDTATVANNTVPLKTVSEALGSPSKFIQRGEGVVLGSLVPTGYNEIVSSITMQKALLANNPKAAVSGTSTSNIMTKEYLDEVENAVTLAERQSKTMGFKTESDRQKFIVQEFVKVRSKGVADFTTTLANNKTVFSKVQPSDFDMYFTNLGSTMRPTEAYVLHMSSMAARSGKRFADKDDAVAFARENSVRLSNFFGTAVEAPLMSVNGKALNESDYVKLVTHTLKQHNLPAGVKVGIEKFRFYPDVNANGETVLKVGVLLDSGRELKSLQYYDAEAIKNLKLIKDYNINTKKAQEKKQRQDLGDKGLF